jgi:hypothetical protein
MHLLVSLFLKVHTIVMVLVLTNDGHVSITKHKFQKY